MLLNAINEASFVTADDKIKPIVYKIWQLNKRSYTTKSKRRNSAHVAKYYLLDTSRVNAQTIALANSKASDGSYIEHWSLDRKFGKVYL